MRQKSPQCKHTQDSCFLLKVISHKHTHPFNGLNWLSHWALQPCWSKRQQRGSCLFQHVLTTGMTGCFASRGKWRQAYHFSPSQPIRSSEKIQTQLRLPSMLVSLNEAHSSVPERVVVCVCVCTCVRLSLMSLFFLSIFLCTVLRRL